MTASLFSRLLGEIKNDISPSGIQKEISKVPARERTTTQLWGVALFWDSLSKTAAGVTGGGLNPVSVMNALGSHSEVSADGGDDFFI